jgi:Brp/Blh family beta-carotene 15,15'-monooxygenase
MSQTTHQHKSFAIISWLNVLIGALMIGWQSLMGPLSSSFQLGYFIIMLLLTGIPHGGLDHVIARTTAVAFNRKFNMAIFLGRYMAVISVYAICWFFLPSISLLIFLLISAWHFGETDIECTKPATFISICRFLWGSFVLLLILLMHQNETTEVLIRISKNSSQVMLVWNNCVLNAKLILLSLLFINISMLLVPYFQHKIEIPFNKFSNLTLILVISTFLPLLPAFALYFGGWHAIRSFELIFNFLNIKGSLIGRNPLRMWTSSLPMSALAGIFFVLALLVWNKNNITWDPLPLAFIFLSIITLPHLDVMDQMIRKNSTPNK